MVEQLTFGASGQDSGHGNGRGPGAASQGFAGAALPGPLADFGRGEDLDEFHIDALGEEFVVLVHQTDKAGTTILAEKLRAAVEEQTRCTVSVGVCWAAEAHDPGVLKTDSLDHHIEGILGRADRALYQAKEGGRNRVVVCEEDPT